MAKDTEKLIRQLSLISFLMAERRSVTALEIKQEVEGYSGMNDDAFARRFYADRAELESLGIELKVEKPAEGYYEAENYTLPPENFYLPAIEFTDKELGALRTALSLLDGEFAYAEPLRLALQQLSWGKPSPLRAPEQRSVALAVTASAGGRELSQRLSKVETAIFRRKTIVFEYNTMGRDATEKRKVDPYHLLYQHGQFYVVGYSHEREDIRVFRLSRIQGKVGYSSKAEHDFPRREDFDPRHYASRTPWQLGDTEGTARVWVSSKIDWLVQRHFGHAGTVLPASEVDGAPDEGIVFETEYGDARQLVSWALGLGDRARVLSPPELVEETDERLRLVIERHSPGGPDVAKAVKRKPAPAVPASDGDGKRETPIRPERFARLVTLAGILIAAAREGSKLNLKQVTDSLQITETELREDIDVLNVVNFGGGSYVLYAEVTGGEIEVDPEPYGDNFAKPARLLPLEAKALVAAIDLIGDHLPEGQLQSARDKIIAALGTDPAADGLQITSAIGDDSKIARAVSTAITGRRLIEIDYYKENEDLATPGRRVEPYFLMNGQEGWYVHSFDPAKEQSRSFRLDRIRSVEVLDETYEPRPGIEPPVDGWARTGVVPESRPARVWISPERARWAREDKRVVDELADGAVVVEILYAGNEWLAGEILKEAGDAAVLEPEDARDAVLHAAEALAGAVRH
ncbi:MAG: proteasome accessory factor [Solirubrobacteraceae bacterium]|jgi:proteasome accessory factor C|nr:proteasome accessory factor [Solirubrobacteraceae bacterium]